MHAVSLGHLGFQFLFGSGQSRGGRFAASPRLDFMVTIIMKKSIRVTKKSRGRPKTTGTGVQIGMRWQSPELTLMDAWIEKYAPDLSRPEAIRRLVELGLKVKK